MTRRNKQPHIETEVITLQRVRSDPNRELSSGFNRYREDPSDIELLDSVTSPYEDSVRRMDIEKFIFTLSYNEVATILFLAMGYKRKEIHELIGYKRVHSINQIVSKVRKLYANEQF